MPDLVSVVTPRVVLPKCQRTALSVEALAQSFLDNLFFVLGRSLERATVNDLYMALAHTVRDRLVERWIRTKNYRAQDVRVVATSPPSFSPGRIWPTTSSTLAIRSRGGNAQAGSRS